MSKCQSVSATFGHTCYGEKGSYPSRNWQSANDVTSHGRRQLGQASRHEKLTPDKCPGLGCQNTIRPIEPPPPTTSFLAPSCDPCNQPLTQLGRAHVTSWLG